MTLPANIQYAWPHPSRRSLHVVSSNGGPGLAGDKHFASALAIDPATGALRLTGNPAPLPSRPIHVSVDANGEYLLTAYNNPSNVTVHRLDADGTVGAPVAQRENLYTGIYAHQILAAPGNRTVLLVTRGERGKAAVEIGNQILDRFEPDVEARRRAAWRPARRMGRAKRNPSWNGEV